MAVDDTDYDVLVVGAGPTGLALAAQLQAFGARIRLIDKARDRVHESRALAIQPRTLEVLDTLRLADQLVTAGNPAVRLLIHAGHRTTATRLMDIGAADTAFPFLLFLSQARTEAILGEHLASRGLTVERGVELVSYDAETHGVVADLRHAGGSAERVRAKYLVGCDGAHSTVRAHAGIDFGGGRYQQTFLLADLDVDGIEPGAIHAFLTKYGPLFFFPLDEPAAWRMIAMRSSDSPHAGETTLAELQQISTARSALPLRLHDPVWMTAFGLLHRHAARYRSDRVFLAGDAAHVHSPAGAQGMNTGIQDAWNLGWKLALVTRGRAHEELLESYDSERRPVGAFVLRFTDRAFAASTSTNPLMVWLRGRLVPVLLPWGTRSQRGRALIFRTISQLGIRYRNSPAVTPVADFSPASAVERGLKRLRTRRARGPLPGDRLPDAQVEFEGVASRLHRALAAPAIHLLLCGPVGAWDGDELERLVERYGGLLVVLHLDRRSAPGVLVDTGGLALERLGVDEVANFVVRPDGHIGSREDSADLSTAGRYLDRWLT